MLYVYEILGRNKIGVCDTDDNVVSYITLKELYDLTDKYNMSVEGFDSKTHSLQAYSSSTSTTQLKTSMILGVDIRVSNDCIVGIKVLDNVTDDIKIRLSDYASSLSNYIFSRVDVNRKITLVLDDNLKSFSVNSFKDMNYRVFNLDVSEVSNQKMAARVYQSQSRGYLSSTFITNKIIIDNNRKRFLKFLSLGFFDNMIIYKQKHYDTMIELYNISDSELKFMYDYLLKICKKKMLTVLHVRDCILDHGLLNRMKYYLNEGPCEVLSYVARGSNISSADMNVVIKYITFSEISSRSSDVVISTDKEIIEAVYDFVAYWKSILLEA